MRMEELIKNADHWINHYKLQKHPFECGFFNEFYRSPQQIMINGEYRNLSTTIITLLKNNQKSTLHRTKSDQIIHYYVGTTDLILHYIDQNKIHQKIILGKNSELKYIIPQNSWFSFELSNNRPYDYVVTGHTVIPGFNYNDFEVASDKIFELYPSLLSFKPINERVNQQISIKSKL